MQVSIYIYKGYTLIPITVLFKSRRLGSLTLTHPKMMDFNVLLTAAHAVGMVKLENGSSQIEHWFQYMAVVSLVSIGIEVVMMEQ